MLLYDDYGNVTATTRFLDGRAITTGSEYTDTNNPDKPTKVTDALGHSTHFVYDGNGSPTQITDPLGHVTQITYEGTQVKTVKDAANVTVVDNTYNAKGQLIASKDALNNVTQYEYYANGAPSRVIDAKGKSTFYTLDSRYNVSQVTDATGHAVSFAYDANGNRTGQSTTRTVPGSGVQTITTGYVYDAAGRLTQTVRADGSRSYTVYNSLGQVDYTRDSLSRITSFSYDELGQKIGITTATTYDLNGNVQASRDRANRITPRASKLSSKHRLSVSEYMETYCSAIKIAARCYGRSSSSVRLRCPRRWTFNCWFLRREFIHDVRRDLFC